MRTKATIRVLNAALDTPPFMALFALMAELDRPLLLHPTLGMDTPDYAGETYSKYELWWALGWPCETSKAMYRLVFAGVLDRWPELKIITHHGVRTATQENHDEHMPPYRHRRTAPWRSSGLWISPIRFAR